MQLHLDAKLEREQEELKAPTSLEEIKNVVSTKSWEENKEVILKALKHAHALKHSNNFKSFGVRQEIDKLQQECNFDLLVSFVKENLQDWNKKGLILKDLHAFTSDRKKVTLTYDNLTNDFVENVKNEKNRAGKVFWYNNDGFIYLVLNDKWSFKSHIKTCQIALVNTPLDINLEQPFMQVPVYINMPELQDDALTSTWDTILQEYHTKMGSTIYRSIYLTHPEKSNEIGEMLSKFQRFLTRFFYQYNDTLACSKTS